jgi:TPR repeat protein
MVISIGLRAVGTCYEKGFGVAKDEARAVQLYKVAANKGVVAAQFNLGERESDQ